MPDSTPEEPTRKLPLILATIGVVIALIGVGRCGAFGYPVEDYGISGALLLLLSVSLLLVAIVMYCRNRR